MKFGNQNDMVSIAPFELDRVAGYRMPVNTLHRGSLPTFASTLKSSSNEA